MPQRIQRKRTKGWRMPDGAVYVGRGTVWGNPWKVRDSALIEWPYPARSDGDVKVREFPITPALAVELYRIAFEPDLPDIIEQLRGKDLACWCDLDAPCHADLLLDLANRDGQEV